MDIHGVLGSNTVASWLKKMEIWEIKILSI